MNHPRISKFLVAIATGTLWGLFAGTAIAAHPTVSLPGSIFEIDTNANLIRDDVGFIDWASVTEGRQADLASGSGDNSFGQGAKEDTVDPSVVSGSIPPNKSDLKTFGVYLEEDGSRRFLHLYWHRVQEPSGTTNMDFEFNQSPNLSANGVTFQRSAGDILIQYDLAQGGTNPKLFMSEWLTGSETPPATGGDCEASNKLPCWGKKIDLSLAGVASGSINTSAIAAIDSDGLGAISPRTFGEASIDFEALAASGSNGCLSFGSAYLKSRSSDSFTSALKDFIAPISHNVSNCASLKIEKKDDNGTLLGGVQFQLFADNEPTGGTYNPPPDEDGTVPLFGCTTASAGSEFGTCTITGILAGNYWIRETAPPTGHDPADPQAVSISAGGQIQTLTFTNPRKPASVTINKKDDTGATLDDAVFTLYDDKGTIGTFESGTDTAVVPARSCTTVNGTCTISDILPPGDYCVDETTVPDGYTQAAARCFSLILGQDLTLADFIDNRQPASVTINKKDDADAALDDAVFTLYDDKGTIGTFESGTDTAVVPAKSCTTVNGTCTISDILPPGNYCVDETTVPDGYTKAAARCFSLVLGQDLTLADFIDNRQPASVTINKKDDADNPLDDAVFTLYDDKGTIGTFESGADTAVVPARSCTTVNGTCTISDILPPGNYCVDETTVPDGYTKAAARCFSLVLGQDLTLADFIDNRQPASVTIIKKDDADNPLDGAQFSLYDDKGIIGTFEPGTDTAAAPARTCTTAAGTCAMSDILPPGDYCVDETVVPTGYSKAAAQCFSLALQQSLELTFVNIRQTGAIRITKTRKHAAAAIPSADPHAGVEFTISGGALTEGKVVTTDAQGTACLDGLLLSSFTGIGDYTVTETLPDHYVADGALAKPVTVTATAECGDGNEANVAFGNTPLSDLSVSVSSQVGGGTQSTISCTLDATVVGAVMPAEENPALNLQNLVPGTYVCTIYIDP